MAKGPTQPPQAASRSGKRAQVLAERQRQQARQRRRSRLLLASSVVVAVVLVATAVVAISLNRGSGSSGSESTTASAAVVRDVTQVPVSTYDAIGAGSVETPPIPITANALTADGKPRVLYVGAEYCPFCAAERWAVVAALSRFGTFSGLGQTASTHLDEFPDTATLSFHGATYTSRYLSFTGYETTTNQRQGAGYAPLDTVPAADQKLLSVFDYPPYVQGDGGGIPFIDLGGKYVITGASYSPQVLQGKTHAEIAASLRDPSSTVARAVDGSANVITAGLCTLTGYQPATVCRSSGVTSAASKLGS